ncbi:Amino-acid acetyltransferase, mitochondrial, partial [Tieghemiomyces parasiticus]
MTLSRLCLRRFHTGQVLREPSQVPQLYLQVLQAFPSQREAQQFLRRVTGRGRTAPALPTTVPPLSLPPRSKPAASKRVLPEADWVASLLNPTRQLIALVVVPTGLSPTHQAQVAQTLVNLVPLGLSPVVLLQPCYTRTAGPAATTTSASCAEDPAVDATVRDRLQQQCLAFVARIEAVPGGLARPIPAGTVFRWSVADPHRIDTDLGPVMTSLKSHRIPVLTPLGVRASESGLATAVLPTDRALGALARRMSQDACGIPAVTPSAPTVDKERTAAPPLPPAVPAEACRVILVTPATPWWPAALTPRLDLGQLNFINLEDEYPRIRSALTGLLADRPTTSHTATDHAKARTALYTLDMIRDCLGVLPTTSSALLVTPDSVGRSIQNWITDKPIALRQASSAAGEVGVPPSGPLITTTRFSDLPATANSGSVALDTTASQRPSALVLRHGLKVT